MFNAETDDIIGQYIIFCHVMDEQIKKYGRKKDAAIEAIRICQDRNVLKDYLNKHEKEVVDIMIALFDQEYAVKQYGNTMKEEGKSQVAKLMAKLCALKKYQDVERASNDPEYLQKLLKEYGLAEA